MFMPPFGRLPNSDGGDDAPLLTTRNWTHIQQQWYGEDPNHANPGVVVIDDLLSSLKQYIEYVNTCSIWYEAKSPRYRKYLCVLTEIAYELHKAMPCVMNGHVLKQLWSYKFESSGNVDGARTGVHVNADDAMIM
jgi:hypothetical protein